MMKSNRSKQIVRARQRILIAGLVVLLASACHEVPQNASKPFAGTKATELYLGKRFDGNKAAFETALAKRAQKQNEYLRIPD